MKQEKPPIGRRLEQTKERLEQKFDETSPVKRLAYLTVLSAFLHGTIAEGHEAIKLVKGIVSSLGDSAAAGEQFVATLAGDLQDQIHKAVQGVENHAYIASEKAAMRDAIETEKVRDVDLSEFFDFVEVYVDKHGLTESEYTVGSAEYELVIAKAKEMKAAGVPRDDALNYLLSTQGAYDVEQYSMYRLRKTKRGNCEARARFLASAIEDVWPELAEAGAINIQKFADTPNPAGGFRDGHQRVVLDEGSNWLVVEGKQVAQVRKDPHIPTYEAHDLYVIGTAFRLGLVDGVKITPVYGALLTSGDSAEQKDWSHNSGIAYPFSDAVYLGSGNEDIPLDTVTTVATGRKVTTRIEFSPVSFKAFTDADLKRHEQEKASYQRVMERAHETINQFLVEHTQTGVTVETVEHFLNEEDTKPTKIYHIPVELTNLPDYPLLLDALTTLGENEEEALTISIDVPENWTEPLPQELNFHRFKKVDPSNGRWVQLPDAHMMVSFARKPTLEQIRSLYMRDITPQIVSFQKFEDVPLADINQAFTEGQLSYLHFKIDHITSQQLHELRTWSEKMARQFNMSTPFIDVTVDDPVITLPDNLSFTENPTYGHVRFGAPITIKGKTIKDNSAVGARPENVYGLPMHLVLEHAPHHLTLTKDADINVTVQDGVLPTDSIIGQEDKINAELDGISSIMPRALTGQFNVININMIGDVVIQEQAFAGMSSSMLQLNVTRVKDLVIATGAFDDVNAPTIFKARDEEQLQTLAKALQAANVKPSLQVFASKVGDKYSESYELDKESWQFVYGI